MDVIFENFSTTICCGPIAPPTPGVIRVKSYGQNKIEFFFTMIWSEKDHSLEFRAPLYIFGISGVKGRVKHTELKSIPTFDFLPPPLRDGFK